VTARTFWHSILVDSPRSQEERPRRKAPETMTTINPRIVRVTITSSKVNPFVENRFVYGPKEPSLYLATSLFLSLQQYLNNGVKPVIL